MSAKNKIIAAALTCSLIIPLLSVGIHAEGSIPQDPPTTENSQSFLNTIIDVDSESQQSGARVRLTSDITNMTPVTIMSNGEQSDLLSYFREETENFSQEIDLTPYNIILADADEYTVTEDDLNARFKKIYELLVYNSPRSYYLMRDNGTYNYQVLYNADDDGNIYVESVYPEYCLDVYTNGSIDQAKVEALRPQVEQKQALLDNEVKYVQLFINYGMTDTEKLVAIHYALGLRYDYDYDSFTKPLSERKNNTAISLIENKTGLCVAYATLFNYIAMQSGIEDTGFVTSVDENGNDYHTWNLVKAATPATGFDERWYNVDVTWDDTISEGFGTSSMAYFFLSTEKINESHNIYDKSGKQIVFAPTEEEITNYLGEPADSTFDDALWHHSATLIVPYSGKWYFILHQSDETHPAVLYEYNPYKFDMDERYKVLFKFKEEWKNGDKVLDHSYTGLGVINGKLYFNCPKKIHSFDLLTAKEGDAVSVDLPDGYSIFSSYIIGNTILYGICPDNNPTNEVPVKGGQVTPEEISLSEMKISNNKLIFKVDTNYSESDPHEVLVTVRDRDDLISEKRIIDSYADPHNSWFTIELNNTSVTNPPIVYVWDKNMKPVTDFFCLGNTVYKHDGAQGSYTVETY